MKPAPDKHKKGIDWQQVRQCLARIMAATEAAQSLSPEQAREVLQARARILAQPPAMPPRASEVLEAATFHLGEESYAIQTYYIREVVRLTEWTPVPGAPDFLLGVINLRGEILAVFDLRRLLGVPVFAATDHTRVLVLGGDRAEYGIWADGVHEVRALRTDDVLTPPASLAGPGREWIRGVTDDALIVLDGAVLLRDRRLYIDHDEEEVSPGHGART